MTLPHLPFEIIQEIAEYLDLATLNALIRTHKRAADTLTPRLYDRSLSDGLEDEEFQSEDTTQVPVAIFNLHMVQCAHSWASEVIVSFLLKRFTFDTLCAVMNGNSYDPDDPSPVWELFLHFMASVGNLKMVQLMKNHHTVVQYLLDAGADIRIIGGHGETALHFASKSISVDIAKVLVAAARAAKEDPFRPDMNGETALYAATWHRNTPAVHLYLEEGADPTLVTENFKYPLGCAFSSCVDESVPKALIKATIDRGGDISYIMRRGMTPLHAAINYSSEELAQYLIDSGADVNATDVNHMTPLHTAIKARKPGVIKSLIAAGADPTARNINRTCPLELSESLAYFQPYMPLLLAGTPKLWPEDHINTKLWKEVGKCNPLKPEHCRILLPLIRHDLTPFEVLDQHGNTALHLLSQTAIPQPGPGSPLIKMARIIIDAGGNIAPRNRKGLKPFHFAIWTPTVVESYTDLIKFYLEYPGVHGTGDGTDKPLDYDGAISVLLKAASPSDALKVDLSGKTPIDRGVEEIQDAELRRRARRLLGRDE